MLSVWPPTCSGTCSTMRQLGNIERKNINVFTDNYDLMALIPPFSKVEELMEIITKVMRD